MTQTKSDRLPSDTDTVVIGAGLCGVSFARHEAETGKRVVLLDAAQIGAGMTGKSAGHVMTGFLPSPAEMSALLGPKETLRLQRWSHESKLALRRRWIDLGLGNSITDGYLLVARTRDEREVLVGVAAYWREQLSIDGVRILAGAELAEFIRSPLIDSALYDPSAFAIDPPALIDGTRRLAQHRGIEVHVDTTVVRVAPEGRRYRVETTRGTTVANYVAICTGAGSIDFVEGLQSPMIPKATFVLVTEPVPVDARREVLPSGLPGSDCSHAPAYWTLRSDGRLMIGGEAAIRHEQLFPDLVGQLSRSSKFVAEVDTTVNGLPIVREAQPGLNVLHGFSGLGLAGSYGAWKLLRH